MISRIAAQSWWWRLLALMMVLAAGLMRLHADLEATRPAQMFAVTTKWVALLGLCGFAFGFRIGPVTFWRYFSVPCCLYTAAGIGKQIGHVLVAPLMGAQPYYWTTTAAVFTSSIFLFLTCVALLRHAELLKAWPNRHRSQDYKAVFS